MKYRKKPVVIEAVQWFPDRPEPAPEWYVEALESGVIMVERPVLKVKTIEGDMTAQVGDWIIRGINGEVYPCKPDIFEATYEAVE